MPRFKDIERSIYDKDYKATMFELFKEGDLAMYTDLEEYAQTFYGDTKNHKIVNLIKNSIEQYLTEDSLNKIKQELTFRKEKLKLNENIELEDLKSSPEK
jgi:hypothetical protein